MSREGAAAPAPRWLVHSTRSLFVVVDHPQSGRAQQGQVSFLGISRAGVAQEGQDTPEGFRAKLGSFGGGGAPPAPLACAAVLGCLSIGQECFLLVAVEVAVAAEVDAQRILEITRCEALPFAASGSPGAEAGAALLGLKQLLERNFYFSHDFDVTQRLQRRLRAGSPSDAALSGGVDARFVWNSSLAEPLLQQGVSARWISPVMQGFVQSRSVAGLQLLLVARRSARRAGTRYNARGLDDDGEAGNWVETEQLARPQAPRGGGGGGWIGLVQVRGSAPIFWEQSTSMSPVTVTRSPELVAVAFEKHHRWMQAEYGEVLYVSLLSGAVAKEETEGVLTAALAHQADRHKDRVRMAHLDFHARVMGEEQAFDRELDALSNEIADEVERLGYLDTGAGKLQRGVVRTNCFDCLDRTNILQYQLVWRWLQRYCRGLPALQGLLRPAPRQATSGSGGGGLVDGLFGVLGDIQKGLASDAPAALVPPLQDLLRGMWADLGDALSMQYTGTASTMGAALRQGGHTAMARLEKGLRSVNRAYTARFEDGARQESMDRLLSKQKLPKAPSVNEARRAPCGRLTVATVTWNVHAAWCADPAVLQTILGECCASGKPPDVIVLCLQEFLELSAANVVLQGSGDEVRQREFEEAVLRVLPAVAGEQFVLVQSVGMVGLYLAVFVPGRLRGSVSAVAVSRLKTGLGGLAANKGAVALRFEVAKTSICALSLHLESGHGAAPQRAAQLREALQNCFEGAKGKFEKAVAKHDLALLGGDFNFRLAVPESTELGMFRDMLTNAWPVADSSNKARCVGEGAPARAPAEVQRTFAEFDELQGSRGHTDLGDALREAGLMEGPVLFPATYRMSGSAASPKYDADRVPAWCDRILHSKVGVSRRRYCAVGGIGSSDHRPVLAVLETDLLALPGWSPEDASPLPRTAPAPPAPDVAASNLMGFVDPGSGSALGSAGAEAPAAADLLGGPDVAGAAAGAPAPRPRPAAAPTSQAVASDPGLDLLGGGPGPAAASLDVFGPRPAEAERPVAAAAPAAARRAPAQAAQAAQAETGSPAPGPPAQPGSLAPGQLVFAEFSGGWYLANVRQARGTTCSISWLRPSGADWGNKAAMARYLCSTGADETCHGEGLDIAAQVRLPERAAGGSRPPEAPPAPSQAAASSDLLDLLG